VFVWGLKRSGIHLVVGWLYANLGATAKVGLGPAGLHPQLFDGYADAPRGVAFFNNCGREHSRTYELGDLETEDFAKAAGDRRATIFGIEDCDLRFASRTAGIDGAGSILVVRDPLNNLASRLMAARTRPEVFPVDDAYLDLYEAYCAEALGRTHRLVPKTVVSFNRFVQERSYRDAVAGELGIENRDVMSEVSEYGGGSSFSGPELSAPASLLSRYREHPLPRPLVDALLQREAVREACSTLFGYDLATQAAAR
jgi:hypothetical protein